MTPIDKIPPESSIRQERVIRIGGWALAALLGLLLVGMMFGRQLHGVLHTLGLDFLYNEEAGVYADCSKPENRSNPYCSSRGKGDRNWRNLKDTKGSPSGFSLY